MNDKDFDDIVKAGKKVAYKDPAQPERVKIGHVGDTYADHTGKRIAIVLTRSVGGVGVGNNVPVSDLQDPDKLPKKEA